MRCIQCTTVAIVVVVANLFVVGTCSHAADTPVPSSDKILGWIRDMWSIGTQGKYGYRMPGTPVDHRAAKYVLGKFQEFGLEDTTLEPVPALLSMPDKWSLTVRRDGETKVEIPCFFLRYASFTPPEGITAEMVYVGKGSEAEFKAKDEAVGVAGKIVIVDVVAPGWSYEDQWFRDMTLFVYDPDNTLPGNKMTENWPPDFSAIRRARQYGAVGYVGILTFTVSGNNQFLHYQDSKPLPSLSVSPDDGSRLRDLLSNGPVEGTLTLTGAEKQGVTYNVYGSLPGKTDEIIVVHSHHDGWATNDASGTAIVMALAKYFAQLPQDSRERKLVFSAFGSHFGQKESWNKYDCLVHKLLHRVVCVVSIEMIGKHYKIVDGKYVETGLVSPASFGITDGNPHLLSVVREAIEEHGLDRSLIVTRFFGEGTKYATAGIPTIERIAENAPQFTNDDTPETVMKEMLQPTTVAFIDIIRQIDVTPADVLKKAGNAPWSR